MRTSPSWPDRPAAELGPCRSETGDGGGSELCKGRIALGELVRNAEDVGVRDDSDDSLTLEVAEDAGARDLKGVRNTSTTLLLSSYACCHVAGQD